MSAEAIRFVRRDSEISIAYGITPSAASTNSTSVVLLHGLASNMTRWSEFVARTSITNSHPLIRVDLRGHGQSVTRTHFDLETWSDDLVAILDHEQLHNAVIVGHSLGAQAALMFARRHPNRTRGLVLIDPVFRPALSPQWQRRAKWSPLIAMSAGLVRCFNRSGVYRRNVPTLDLAELDRQARIALLDAQSKAAFIEQYSSTRADLKTIPHANYLQDMVEMFREVPAVSSIHVPTLAILSTGATFASTERMGDALAALPSCAIKLIACEHWPLTEKPTEVREMIEQWIEATFPLHQ
ncbi:MAG: alpha/beta hydrolase [Betaproteobacteria bacterium]|nr:MAG: alpha/beta hydrolase [Betaproteobacteria bacterium]